MNVIMDLLQNSILNIALLAWITAQVMKTIFYLVVTKKFNPERLVGAGGMPSAHSATVCALVVAVARKIGFASPEFAIAFILAAVVMYDAMGVRRAAGEQAKILNKMLETQGEDDDGPEQQAELKEYLGHTPMQVLAGSLLGILLATVIPV